MDLQFVEDINGNSLNYYTLLPECLSFITYLDEYNNKKRLSAEAKELYRVIKMSCGDSSLGVCVKDRCRLAEDSNLELHLIESYLEELKQSFTEIDGKSLIYEEERPLENFKKDGFRYLIKVNDIWKENQEFFSRSN